MGVSSARLADTTPQCGLEFNSVPAAAAAATPALQTVSIYGVRNAARGRGRVKDKVAVFFSHAFYVGGCWSHASRTSSHAGQPVSRIAAV